MATVAQPERAAPQQPTYHEITRDVVATLGRPSRTYFVLLAVVLAVLALGGFALLWQVRWGLGVAGYTPPVLWGVYITTFVFWVGIAHSGTLRYTAPPK
jgi:molybdopterin-containing oxidoreductase family membrane subunit